MVKNIILRKMFITTEIMYRYIKYILKQTHATLQNRPEIKDKTVTKLIALLPDEKELKFIKKINFIYLFLFI